MVIVFDLDDTLYDEVDFVKSGFSEVSRYLGSTKYYDFMIEEFYQNGSGKIFDKLVKEFNLEISVNKLIEIYRFHKPKIKLPQESIEILEWTKNQKTALISDGHYITQQNKFFALNLDKYIDYPIFTDFYHTKKPELKPFKMVMDRYPNEEYIYISDNPKKDFLAPNKLNWNSVRFKNKNGIYKDFENNAKIEVNLRNGILEVLKELV